LATSALPYNALNRIRGKAGLLKRTNSKNAKEKASLMKRGELT
jgi:hypothetical protein